MSDRLDPTPALAVRVVPPYRERWDRIGRLYHKPGFQLPSDFQSLPVLTELIRNGDLMPSITNVIGVRNSPYLVDWAAKMVATESIKLALKHVEEIRRREQDAFKYLRNLPYNEMTFWGTQGTNIHSASELLFWGKDVSHFKLTEYEKKSLDQLKRFLDHFQPTCNYTEITGFGTTKNNRNFAGTADFHITVNGVKILGDLKCTTEDTLILMKDGSQKFAKDITVGDEVVSWSEKDGLRVDQVSFVGPNGEQPTYTVWTDLGQQLTVTGNHKFLKHTKTGQDWVESEKLERDDRVYTVIGWNHSPFRDAIDWPFNKHLSPYLFGMLWALAQHNDTDWTDAGKVSYPDVARDELIDELASFGFLKSADDKIRVKTGLRRVANKARITIDELLDYVNSPNIPGFVFSAPIIYQTAFMSGVQEVFSNKTVNEEFFFVEHRSATSLRSLQQLYFNNGQVAKLGGNPKTNKPVLRLPIQSGELVHIYGLEEVKVIRVLRNDTPVTTVAIEVKNTHNHVTNSLLTHNTNRTGLHADIALQLAANRNVGTITPDNENLIAPPETDITVGLHLSPEKYTFKEVDSSESIMNTFEALRDVWEYHAFDGSFGSDKGVFLRSINSPADL